MPCMMHDEDWDNRSRKNSGMTSQEFEAVLCGVFTSLVKRSTETGVDELFVVLRDVDWIEVGVKPAQVKTWWRRHLKQDEARRAQEAAEKERQRIKAQALSKLTDEEKKALGIRNA